MGLLQGLFGGDKGIQLYAPADGELLDISKVSDPTFAQKMLGDGIALHPADGRFCAPADGKMSTVFPTGHAFSMVTEDGAEILVHIGFDTVKLKGRYFKVYAKDEQSVKKGELLVEADLEGIRREGYDLTTPVVVLNSSDYKEIRKESGSVKAGDRAITLVKK